MHTHTPSVGYSLENVCLLCQQAGHIKCQITNFAVLFSSSQELAWLGLIQRWPQESTRTWTDQMGCASSLLDFCVNQLPNHSQDLCTLWRNWKMINQLPTLFLLSCCLCASRLILLRSSFLENPYTTVATFFLESGLLVLTPATQESYINTLRSKKYFKIKRSWCLSSGQFILRVLLPVQWVFLLYRSKYEIL